MERLLVFLQFREALSQDKVRLTLDEQNILIESNEHARRALWISFSVAGYAVWLGTRRLRNVLQVPFAGDIVPLGQIVRLSLTSTSAIWGGAFGIQHSFGLSFEHILNQEGSQIQQELGNVLVSFLETYPQLSDGVIKQHVSKHFYLEKVFDDFSTDGPKQVWLYRNNFRDCASTSQRTRQSDYYSENIDLQPNPINVDNPLSPISGVQRRDSFANKESSADDDTMSDPFDWIFPTPVPQRVEDIKDAASSTMSSRRHKRSHKRSRHRVMSRREASTNMQHALADKGLASI